MKFIESHWNVYCSEYQRFSHNMKPRNMNALIPDKTLINIDSQYCEL